MVEGGAAPFLAVDGQRDRVYVASCVRPLLFVLSAHARKVQEVHLPAPLQGIAVDSSSDRVVVVVGKEVLLLDNRNYQIVGRLKLPAAGYSPLVDQDMVFILSPPRMFILNLATQRLVRSAAIPRDTECAAVDTGQRDLLLHSGGSPWITEVAEDGKSLGRHRVPDSLVCDLVIDPSRDVVALASDSGQLFLLASSDLKTRTQLTVSGGGVGWLDLDEVDHLVYADDGEGIFVVSIPA